MTNRQRVRKTKLARRILFSGKDWLLSRYTSRAIYGY